LKAAGVQHFEIENATDLPLFGVMRLAHYHITCWSTVCYEALVFGLPTSIVHENGKSLFEDYIRRGIFAYAETGAQLLAQIAHSDPSQQIAEPHPYIVADDALAHQAFQSILPKDELDDVV
jgi:hypothetical protein